MIARFIPLALLGFACVSIGSASSAPAGSATQQWSSMYMAGDVQGTLKAISANLAGENPDPGAAYAWTCIERSLGQLGGAFRALPAGRMKSRLETDVKVQLLLASKRYSELLKTCPASSLEGVDGQTLSLVISDLCQAYMAKEAIPYLHLELKKAPNSFLGPLGAMAIAADDLGRTAILAEFMPNGELAGTPVAKAVGAYIRVRSFTDIERIAITRKWLATHPNDHAALAWEGEELQKGYQNAAAFSLIDRAEHSIAWAANGLLLGAERAQALYMLGRKAEARAVAVLDAKLTTATPSAIPQKIAETEVLFALNAGEKGEARSLIETGVKRFPSSAALYGQLALLELGYTYRAGPAQAAAKRAVERDPHDPVYREYLMKALAQANDWAAAFITYKNLKADRLEPTEPTYNQIRYALDHTGHKDEAVTELRNAVAASPNSPFLHFDLAKTLESAGNRTEAIYEIQKALALRSNFQSAIETLCDLTSNGRQEEKIRVLRDYVRAHPEADTAWVVLWNQLRTSNADAALKIWREASDQAPATVIYYRYDFGVLFNAGKYTEADASLRRARARLKSVYPDTLANLLESTMYSSAWYPTSKVVDRQAARQKIADARAYLVAGGNVPYALQEMAYAEQALGNDQAAFDACISATKADPDNSQALWQSFNLEPRTSISSHGQLQAIARLIDRDPYDANNLQSAGNWYTQWVGCPVLGYFAEAKMREVDLNYTDRGYEAKALGALGDSTEEFRTSYQQNFSGISPSDRYVAWFDGARSQVRRPSTKVSIDATTGLVRIGQRNGTTLTMKVHPVTGNPTYISMGRTSITCDYTPDGEELTRIESSRGKSMSIGYDAKGRVSRLVEFQHGKAILKQTIRYDASGRPVGEQRNRLDEDEDSEFAKAMSLIAGIEQIRFGRAPFIPVPGWLDESPETDRWYQPSSEKRSITKTANAVTDTFGRVFDIVSDNVHGVTYVARGVSIEVVDHKNPRAGAKPFAQTQTTLLALDGSGRLVANSGPDIVRFEAGSSSPEKLFSAEPHGPSDRVGGTSPTSLIVANDGVIWCTSGPSTFRFDGKRVEEFSMYANPALFPARSDMISRVVETRSGKIRVVASDEEHRIYQGVALAGGLLEFDGRKFNRIGNSYLNDLTWFYTGYTPVGPNSGVVATSGSFCIDEHGDGNLNSAESDPSYRALRKSLDMLWLGTQGASIGDGYYIFGCAGGLIGKGPRGWFFPQSLNDSLPDRALADWGGHTVHAVAADDAGHIYAGTDGGLMIYTGTLASSELAPKENAPLLKQTVAVCNRTVYSLGAPGSELSNWSYRPTGRLSGPIQWSRSPSGRAFVGRFNQQALRLALNKLPAHKHVHVEIELFLIGSWDGNDQHEGPDVMDIQIPGVGTALHSTFANFTEDDTRQSGKQSYPDAYPGGSHKGQTGASEIRTLGFTDVWDSQIHRRDTVYKLQYTFAHSGPNMEIVITGDTVADGGARILFDDETWGIGNIVVKTDR